MFEISIPDQISELYDVEATVAADVVEQLEKLEFRDAQHDIKGFLRGKSRISIGNPLSVSLANIIALSSIEIPVGMQTQLRGHEFCVVHIPCSFTPAENCRFHTAKIELEIRNVQLGSQSDTAENPIVYDMFPIAVKSKHTITRKFGLNPDITLKFGEVGIGASLIELEQTKEVVVYECQIEAFGLRESKAGWTFQHTEQHAISGIQNLFLVIQKPRLTNTTARIRMDATVEPLTGIWPLQDIPLSTTFRSSGTIIDEPHFPLC